MASALATELVSTFIANEFDEVQLKAEYSLIVSKHMHEVSGLACSQLPRSRSLHCSSGASTFIRRTTLPIADNAFPFDLA